MDLDLEFDLWHPERMEEFVDGFSADVDEDIAAVLDEYGPQIVQRAQQLSPVDTGALRDSIDYETDAEARELYIYGEIYYYPYVEFGTVKMAGAHMVETAYGEFEPELLQAIDNAIQASAGDY
jgi:HK97 gp10 family phage protein